MKTQVPGCELKCPQRLGCREWTYGRQAGRQGSGEPQAPCNGGSSCSALAGDRHVGIEPLCDQIHQRVSKDTRNLGFWVKSTEMPNVGNLL